MRKVAAFAGLTALAALALAASAFAAGAFPDREPPARVPAYPGLRELRQPDGSAFQARQWGEGTPL